jgi:hypothetical protein
MATEKDQIVDLLKEAGLECILGHGGDIIFNSPSGDGESIVISEEGWFFTLDTPAKSPPDGEPPS